MTLIREDVLEYAEIHGKEQAADLLRFAGRDKYEGDDFDILMDELDGSAVRYDVYNALAETIRKHPGTSKDEIDRAIAWFYDHFFEEVPYDEYDSPYDETDRGTYSPPMPWNAPGMKVSDFI